MEAHYQDFIMDLAWRQRLSERYVIHVRSKSQPPDSDHTPEPKYLGSGPAGIKYYWEGSRTNKSSLANHSALYADNDFLMKSRVLTDMLSHPVKHHSFTTVLVMASIFLFFTITITIAIVVFCRKKNTVFALQKSEQEDEDDGDYELDDLNTDVEYTETDAESEYDNISRRKSYPLDASEDPSYRLLGGGGATSTSTRRHHRPAADPFHGVHRCRCQHGHDDRGAYRTMVVAAVLEKRRPNADDDRRAEPEADDRTTGYARCPADADADSDDDDVGGDARCHLINHSGSSDDDDHGCVYCQSANANNNNCSNVVLQSSLVEGAYDNVQNLCSKCQSAGSEPSCLYVALPPETNKLNGDNGTKYYVKLPPKKHDNTNENDANKDDVDDAEDDDYDIGINYHELSSNSGSCVIDLHPEATNRRPNSLRLCPSLNSDYFNPNGEVCGVYSSDDLGESRASVRSRSVTENLSAYASHPAAAYPDYSLQSCPETPLMEQSGSAGQAIPVGFNLARGSGSLPYHHYSTNEHTISNAKYSDTMLYNESHKHQASSVSSIEQKTGFSFILSSPYSSLVSLTKVPVSETDPQQPGQCYRPVIASSPPPRHPADCRPSLEINNDIHQLEVLRSGRHLAAQEYGQTESGEGTSTNRNGAGTTRDNSSNVIGQENAPPNDQENNPFQLGKPDC